MQHVLHNQNQNWRVEGGFVQEGESIDEAFADPSDLKNAYDTNMDGVQELWETGKFDTLVIASDHGSDILDGGEAHDWPAYVVIYSDEFPGAKGLQGEYEDVPATILDLLEVDRPDWYEGKSFKDQANITSKLKDLGYLG